MEYHRTFLIGEREAMDFYLYQAARRKLLGALGFGVVGLLVCYLYTAERVESAASFAVAMLTSFAATRSEPARTASPILTLISAGAPIC